MKHLFTVLCCMIALTACAEQTNFKMTVMVPATDTSTMFYIITDKGAQQGAADSVMVNNGKVEWATTLDKLTQGLVVGNAKDGSRTVCQGLIFAPGEEMTLTTQGKSYYVSGSQFYRQYDAADRFAETIMADYKTRTKDASREVKKDMGEQAIQKIRDYAKQHGGEEGVLALASYLGAGELAKLITPSERVKTYLDLAVAREEAERQAEAEREAKMNAMNGKPAPDFTLNDLQGKPLSVSQLKGKYLILDFWGSWCIWCIRGIPKMKEYYQKYSGKLEILGIDCNDTDAKWRDAVKQHEIPWLHVYNPRSSSVLKDYSVQGFPTKVIVDPQGNVVKTIVGEDPKFYEFLDELLK